jgi:signal transduction histidine kinase
MRWPIRVQLLLPMLLVVVLAIVLASAASAYFSGSRARQQQEEDLRRVVATLSQATFPLTNSVLRQMNGLSGADFVFFAPNDELQSSTMSLSESDLDQLRAIPESGRPAGFSNNLPITLAGQTYLGDRVAVSRWGSTTRAGSLVVLYPEDRWWASIHEAAYPALAAGTIAALVAMAVTALLANRFVKPIRKLGEQTAAIVRGDFRPAAVARRDDEIRDLTLAINRMAEQLGLYEGEVRRNERLRTLGQLGAGMAHQLRNAATGGRMAIELHQRECEAEPARESLDVALRQLRLMESYLERFLAVGRPTPARRERLDLDALVEDSLSLVRPACDHAGIDLRWEKRGSPVVMCGDPDSLRQLFLNLLMNAVEATRGQHDVPPTIDVQLDAGDSLAVVRFNDSGPGPAIEVQPQLFEPFVTGKPDGTGLGLFVARRIAETHGGSVAWCRNGGMTCFTVTLPTLAS